MKITKQQLQKLIQEELKKVLEASMDPEGMSVEPVSDEPWYVVRLDGKVHQVTPKMLLKADFAEATHRAAAEYVRNGLKLKEKQFKVYKGVPSPQNPSEEVDLSK